MPDAMDAIQENALNATAQAVEAHARRPRAQGLDLCERMECGQAIGPERRELGARLCLECQRAQESRFPWQGGKR